jgi:hypothetical protein
MSISGRHSLPDLHARDLPGRQVLTADQFRRRAALSTALAAVRARLDEFSDPPAARRELAVVEHDPHDPRTREALQELMRHVRPGTEALICLNALFAAVRAVTARTEMR